MDASSGQPSQSCEAASRLQQRQRTHHAAAQQIAVLEQDRLQLQLQHAAAATAAAVAANGVASAAYQQQQHTL
jgi:hypothetical protein